VSDARVIADLLLARLAWLAAAELIVRPLLRLVYRRADAATGGRLPDL
jgi:hypothetical protein